MSGTITMTGEEYDALRAENERGEQHRNDMADKIVAQRTELGALRTENERLVNEQLAFADAVAQKLVAKDAQIESLRAENERLTMQLTACGVVALSNTPDSAAKARDMHPDYMSASCQDVMRVVDSEIALRAELAALRQPVADTQQAEREAFEALLNWAEQQVCTHESTHRGGAIWEICDECGAKWADDRGGKPAFKWPDEIVKARAALSAPAADATPDVSALVEALTTIRAMLPAKINKQAFVVNGGPPLRADDDDEFYSAKKVNALVNAIVSTVDAALAAHKAGGGDHE